MTAQRRTPANSVTPLPKRTSTFDVSTWYSIRYVSKCLDACFVTFRPSCDQFGVKTGPFGAARNGPSAASGFDFRVERL